MTRRTFIPVLSAAALARSATQPAINAARLRERIEKLSEFGRPPGGTFADGVSRVAFSDADIAGRAYVRSLIVSAGLMPRVDAAGNISAIRSGSGNNMQPVLIGSHIDTVPNGGNFDGVLGSLSAIEVVQALKDADVTTKRPIEVVIWANEEGVAFNNGLYGSRAAAGKLEPGELDTVWEGMRKSSAIGRIDGDAGGIAKAQRKPGSFHAYVELHIEQGGVLDKAGVPIGIVEGIVAIDRYDVEIHGVANHAGTTPMPERKDALLAAAQLIQAVNEIVRREPGAQVGTVGQLAVTPNAPNVVPGLVKMTVELRDLSSAKIARLGELVKQRAQVIAGQTQTQIDLRPAAHHAEAIANADIQSTIENVCQRMDIQTRRLASGAGHDAQMMATLGRMGMIFVPSVGGISHSPKEFTRWEDCARGADVLLKTVLELAK